MSVGLFCRLPSLDAFYGHSMCTLTARRTQLALPPDIRSAFSGRLELRSELPDGNFLAPSDCASPSGPVSDLHSRRISDIVTVCCNARVFTLATCDDLCCDLQATSVSVSLSVSQCFAIEKQSASNVHSMEPCKPIGFTLTWSFRRNTQFGSDSSEKFRKFILN